MVRGSIVFLSGVSLQLSGFSAHIHSALDFHSEVPTYLLLLKRSNSLSGLDFTTIQDTILFILLFYRFPTESLISMLRFGLELLSDESFENLANGLEYLQGPSGTTLDADELSTVAVHGINGDRMKTWTHVDDLMVQRVAQRPSTNSDS